MLNAAELRPRALPPASILVVRRLGPGLPPIRVDGHGIRPPADWQEAVLDELDRLARLAVRPAGGPVPERAESVLFLDRAELLACLAGDWVDGTLTSHWWWPSLFPRERLEAAVVRTWMESPEYAPAAIERLAWTRKAAAFVRKLPGMALPVMARDVVRAFALRDLERVIGIVFENPAVPETVVQGEPPFREAAPSMPVSPPWAPWVPEARDAALTIGQRAFLGIALSAQRAPQAVRSRAFAAQVQVWAQASVTVEMGSLPQPGLALAEPIPMGDARAEPVAAASPPEAVPIPTEVAARVAEIGESEGDFEAEEAPPEPLPVVEMATVPEFCLERTPFDGVKIETEFGGLFYLINLGIYLGYYGDFSTPDEPGIELPIWDFLTLVGRRCATQEWSGGHANRSRDRQGALESGPGGKRSLTVAALIGIPDWPALAQTPSPAEDPVWGMLARLAGRPEFEQPRWDLLDEAMERVKAWIAAEKVEGLVVMHPARVLLTGTHLDVFLSLEELPVEIRIARLDRDPGWVPAAGRYIAFHFQ
jgi:hypothetical protein